MSTWVFLAPDEPGRLRRVLSLRKPLRYRDMNPLVTLSGYTGPRAACREGYACGADETHLLRRAGLDCELANWAAGAQLIQLVGREELHG